MSRSFSQAYSKAAEHEGVRQPDYPKMGLLLPKMPLLSQRIPANLREPGEVIGFGNSKRITNLLLNLQPKRQLPIPKRNTPPLSLTFPVT